MKIAVLGCGAMGSIYAAFLSEHHEVIAIAAIDVWHEHVQAINSVGLRVEESTGKVRTVKMTATAADSKLGDPYPLKNGIWGGGSRTEISF